METLTVLDPLWSLSPHFRCPLVGSCLTVSEQGKILKKSGHEIKRASDYEIHHTLMEQLDSENRVSLRTDRYIRHKHKKDIARYSNLPDADLKAHWDEACKNGDMGALFFVIMSRPDVPSSLKATAFGDVHMLSHSSMSDVLNSRKTMDAEVHANRSLTRRLRSEKDKNRDLKSQIKTLDHALKKEAAKNNAEKRSGAPDDGPGTLIRQNHALAAECNRLRKTLGTAGEQAQKDRDRILKLETIISELQSDNRALSANLRNAVCPCPETTGCSMACTDPAHTCDTCAKRVLLVGGITKMEPFYRDRVESSGHEFVYHDGYIRNGSRQINDMVAQADLVLCPVNCISHNTCQRIKKLCKKYNTSCKMLPSASLTMLSRAMTDDILPVLNA